MRALVFSRKPGRFAAAMAAGTLLPGAGARVGPLQLRRDAEVPELPGAGWVEIRPRLAGICGSDLATIDGRSSRYFEPIVSFPFTPGHEVVADVVDPATGDVDDGRRVVLEPVLGCVARGIDPVCAECAEGRLGNCVNVAFGALAPGLQSGFCCDTGGGWSTRMVAHRSQLHDVPPAMSDEAAVMVEPTACAVHGALAHVPDGPSTVVVLGAGTLGLLTVAALAHFRPAATLVAVAKHPEQRRWARALGAGTVVGPGELRRTVRRLTGSMALSAGRGGDGEIAVLTGGADVVIDCVGSSESVGDALSVIRPRGAVTLVGMAGRVQVDLTPLWHKELRLAGAYAYGLEPAAERRRTFDLAFELVQAKDLGRLVSATYPLARYEDAIAHAAQAGARGAVKIAFDLRDEKERTR